MKNQFLPFEHAKMMKELGFNEICFAQVDIENQVHPLSIDDYESLKLDQEIASYNGKKSFPSALYQQTEEWLWKKHKAYIYFAQEKGGTRFRCCAYYVGSEFRSLLSEDLDSYEALELRKQCILKAIEYIHSQKK